MAGQLIDALASDWDPKRYKDTYQDELKKLIRAKEKGKEITVSEPEEEPQEDVGDLMAALEASLAKRKSTGAKRASGTKPRKNRAA